jgi:hypothetical protein
MLGTITNTVTDNVTIPQLVTGAISAGFTAFVGAMFLGAAGFIWWYVKRRITKSEEAEEAKGPVLHKKEHDEDCEDWRIKHDQAADIKHDQIIASIGGLENKFDNGMDEMKKSIGKVHGRIDAHLEAEAARR